MSVSEYDQLRAAEAVKLQQSEAGLHQTQRILVMLDALLDTRLGALHEVNRDAAVKLLRNPKYFTRANDDLSQLDPAIDRGVLEAAYKNRTADTLVDSLMTPMVACVANIVKLLEEQRINTPYVERVEVLVNLWPYDLSTEEKDEIAAAMCSYLPFDVIVDTCTMPVSAMTVEMIKREFSGVILYDLAEWMLLHGREFEHVKIPAVTMWAPKLHANGQQAFKVGDLGEEFNHLDPYETIEKFIAPLVALELLDVEYFSILRPERLKALQRARQSGQL